MTPQSHSASRSASPPRPTVVERLFGADLRSIAAFRMALALVVLGDLAARAADLKAHYTDSGVLPRPALLEVFAFLHEWPLCLNLVGGHAWSQALLFALTALAAAALLLGFRARVACALCWLLVASIQLRNLYVGHGSDAQLRMLLLWGCFLPLGARWAVDRADGRRRFPTGYVFCLGTVAVLLQESMLYLATGWAKSLQPEWQDGTAVARALDNDMWATWLGMYMVEWPTLCRVLTHAVLYLELLAPLLLIGSALLGPARALVVGALIMMHMGFAAGLRVGIFPWVSAAGLLIFLPAWFWEQVGPAGGRFSASARRRAGPVWWRVEARLALAGEWLRGRASRREERSWSWMRDPLGVALLAFTVFWNFGVARDAAYVAPPAISWFGETFFLQQDWRMFARTAKRTGWVIIPGRLRDGSEVDLFAAGGPLPSRPPPVRWEKPEPVLYRVKSYRWLGFVSRMVFQKRGPEQLRLYGQYLCREWNESHEGTRQLVDFDIYFMSRAVHPQPHEYSADDYDREHLWEHWCFAPPGG